MGLASTTIHVGLLLVSGGITAALAGFSWRHRREPGGYPFAILMVALTVWSVSYAVGLLTTQTPWRLLIQRVMWFGAGTVHLWLFLFALSYTGHDEILTPRSIGLLGVIPLTVIVGVWTNPLHHLMWARQSVEVVDGLALMDPAFGPLFWINTIYGYALVGIAAALLIRLIYQSDYLYVDQSALLVLGVAAPFSMNFLDVFVSVPIPGVDYTPAAFTVTGLAFGYALFRRRLFELVPATRQIGRSATFRHLEDGVVIVDADQTVIYCNPVASELFDGTQADVLGVELHALVDGYPAEFEAAELPIEFEHAGAVYEVRPSPIRDRREQLIGYTIILQDITARKERERRLAQQQRELELLNDLNAVIRGVNQALVSATSRDEIETAVCDRLSESDLYSTATISDFTGAVGDELESTLPEETDPSLIGQLGADEARQLQEAPQRMGTISPTDQSDDWTVVPLVYGRTVYGVLILSHPREAGSQPAVTTSEREVLAELGETIGHAIDAVEHRRLLAAESVVELEFRSERPDERLLETAVETGASLELNGLVPQVGDGHLVYLGVRSADPTRVATVLESTATTPVRTIREEADRGLVEWVCTGESVLGTLVDHGGHVLDATASDGSARYIVEVASRADARTLKDRVEEAFPGTQLAAKRERDRPVERADGLSREAVEKLTDRQREALEAAYRAGYFDWPRQSTAEEVAQTLAISRPTFQGHLRKAERELLADLFDHDPSSEPP